MHLDVDEGAAGAARRGGRVCLDVVCGRGVEAQLRALSLQGRHDARRHAASMTIADCLHLDHRHVSALLTATAHARPNRSKDGTSRLGAPAAGDALLPCDGNVEHSNASASSCAAPVAEVQRAAEGDDPLADAQRRGLAQLGHRQPGRRADAQHRQVRLPARVSHSQGFWYSVQDGVW
jgi:hypothetical protein